MVYFDTSFLAPLVRTEATSFAIERFVSALAPENLAVSRWTLVEFASLLAREVRMGGFTTKDADAVEMQFTKLVQNSFDTLSIANADFDLARRYLARYDTGLRAGDALHLAIAQNNKATAIYSLDSVLLKAGHTLGLPVSRGIEGA